jgi:Invasion associated locus B (IalB) protein
MVMKSCRIRAGLSIVLALLLAPPGQAQTEKKHAAAPTHSAATSPAQRIGGAGAWNAYLYKAKSGRVCYLAGAPQKSEPAKFRHKPPSMTVTHRPEENVFNVVSFDEGYLLKEGSDTTLAVDGTKFDLFTKGDSAWSRTADLDKTIVEAMAKGKQAVVKGIPEKGPPTTQTYSLAGFAQTLALIDKACGVKREP